MTGKTIIGKKCPQCASFIKDGQVVCKACGFHISSPQAIKGIPRNQASAVTTNEEDRKTKEKRSGQSQPKAGNSPAPVARASHPCSKCQTPNHPDAKFCKICKHPLPGNPPPFDDKETVLSDSSRSEPKVKKRKQKTHMKMQLHWLDIETGNPPEKQLIFEEFQPFFDGCLEWMGYIFCLYRNKGTYEILCRRSIHSTPGPQQPLLYKKCASKKKNGDEQSNPKTIVETSGTVFYLGAIKFKLMGNKILPGPGLKEGANHFIHDPGERTVLVKPGRPWADDDEHQGLMRVKIPDRDLALDTLQITGRIPLGRHFLQEHLEIDEDFLRRSGVSGEHLNLTPLQGGNWIIEPFPGKAVFLELGERPVRLQQGDILRLAAPQQVGEFVISLSC